ncbi:MAG: methylated-DNA--[protein]-cysteine S-methyltransferase [Legionellaceae bacterium]|nr:methylated-DNA--[protein]-cysteine S-methyltransferase [Legionellaceae bacterium]
MLKKAIIQTPLGDMLAISDDNALYLLEFVARKNLDKNIQQLLTDTHTTTLLNESTAPLASIQEELRAYFKGQLKKFHTAIQLRGTPFQQNVWRTLSTIPYGETRSYAKQAQMLKKPQATRAVANANARNQFAILVPCHRVIRTDKTLGGYAAGPERKQWLLQHEQATYREMTTI